MAVHMFHQWCSISRVSLITRLSNVPNLQVSNKLVRPCNTIMYCSSELTRSYSGATRQILHVKSYSYAEHTKSNSCVVLNSDLSAA